MQSKTQTNDETTRLDFKSKLQSRIEKAASTPVFVSDVPVERVYMLPYNYENLSDAALLSALTINPDWQYTSDAANYVLAILNGQEPWPSFIHFEVSPIPEVSDQSRPVKPKAVRTFVETPVEVEKRVQFKNNLLNKVQSKKVVAPVPTPVFENEQIVVSVPSNYHTLSPITLHGILVYEKGLHPEAATEVVEALTGQRKSNNFNVQVELDWVAEEPAQELTEVEEREIEVRLPFNFNNLRIQDRFLWLMKESNLGLSHAEANDVIDILEGKPQVTGTKFTLIDTQEPPIPVETGIALSAADVPVRKLTYELPEFPDGFETLTRVEQYRVLTDSVLLTPEHARFVLDTLQAQAPVVAAVPDNPEPQIIYVSLPYAFRAWEEKDRFNFLTKVKHLSTQDAEDVLAHWNGQQQLSTVLLDWEDTVDPEGRFSFKSSLANKVQKIEAIPEPEIRKFDRVELPEEFSSLRPVERYQYLISDLALTPEHALLVLADTETAPSEVVNTDKGESYSFIWATLPHVFKTWNVSDQFAYLTKAKHLDTEEANEALAFYNGKTTTSVVVLEWENTVEDDGRLSFKAALADKVKGAKVSEPKQFIIEKKAIREVENIEDVSNFAPTPQPVEITLPIGFDGFKPFDKHLYLTRTLKLPIDDAERLLSGDSKFIITYAAAAPIDKVLVSPLPVMGQPKAKKGKKAKTKIYTSLPPTFNSLPAGEQYWYLVKTKDLSYAEANDLLAVLANKPQVGEYEFVIEWEE